MATLAALGIACSVAAQGTVAVNPAPPQRQSLTITGKLELIDGAIAIKADVVVYYMPELRRLAGFVPAVQVTGNSFPIMSKPGYSRLAVAKLTVAGKDYDLSNCYRAKQDKKSKHR
jgi:hypothetical protein